MDPRSRWKGFLAPRELGAHHFFDANGRTERPADFQDRTRYWSPGAFGGPFNYEPGKEHQHKAGTLTLPKHGMVDDPSKVPAGAITQQYSEPTVSVAEHNQILRGGQATQPAQQQVGAAMPQALGANALMGAGQQMQEKRQTMMPLQGYQNALLRGF